ncbi:MAG: ornithine cyclodeaminase family protein [Gemmobacter sp.]
MQIIGPEAERHLTWAGLTDALEAGHARPRAAIGDTLLARGADRLLSRAAWIDGMGMLVKSAPIMPGNAARGLPTVNGAVTLFDDATGVLTALIDFHLVTKWKTAGDSLLSAKRLARADARDFLIVGAGTVGRSMIEAYRSHWPDARFTVWNRTPEGAARLAAEVPGVAIAGDLEAAVRAADVIATATMATEPLIRGDWLRPGQHIDLIGAYTRDMREADDAVLARGSLYVDCRETTIAHIGDLTGPLMRGVISEADILADFYDIPEGLYRRRSAEEITVAKNGGGAHLDLMTAVYIRDAVAAA